MSPTIDLLLAEPIAPINPNLYGHFIEHLGACVYDGIWAGGRDRAGLCDEVVGALRELRPPVIRWPGGCFADDYHWQDGIGPPAQRPRRVNLHWGQVIDNNAFGTHEFIALCRALGAEAYVCGNVGSGSPREMRDWVEYCNFPGGSTLSDLRAAHGHPDPFSVRYWGVGNEAWGCGGCFTPEDYAGEYRRFSSYLHSLSPVPPYLIACGPDGNNLDWTRRFFHKLTRDFGACRRIHGYAAHYYCGTAGTATDYTADQWYELLDKATRMEELILEQRQAMDSFDAGRRIQLIVDEWGTWHPPTPGRNPAFLWQQNTLRDALVAGITLDIFNRHADIVHMANIAQAVNVLQAMLLTEGGKVVRTPTYHVYSLYRNHHAATGIRTIINGPPIDFAAAGESHQLAGLLGSASLRQRTLTLTVVNPHVTAPAETLITLRGDGHATPRAAIVRETLLTHADIHAHNTFDDPDHLVPSDPRVLSLSGPSFVYTFGPRSVTRLELSLV